jgi:hypothetical protein
MYTINQLWESIYIYLTAAHEGKDEESSYAHSSKASANLITLYPSRVCHLPLFFVNIND